LLQLLHQLDFLQLSGLFNDDAKVKAFIKLFLFTVPITYGAYGISLQSNYFFNAVNKPLYSAMLTILRLFILMVPLAMVGAKYLGVLGVFLGVGLSNIVSGLVSYYSVRNFSIIKAIKD
jgi:Na+-driven multidrug efflux pump